MNKNLFPNTSFEINEKKYLEMLYILLQEFNDPNFHEKYNENYFRKKLLDLNQTKLIKFIQRHKLISIVNDSRLIERCKPSLKDNLSKLNKESFLIQLKIGTYLLHINNILNEIKVDFIFFKGIPLSIQAYEDFHKRGVSSDIDILINPRDLKKVVNYFKKYSFEISKFDNSFILKGFKGLYSRFIFNELNLINNNDFNTKIDIHWRFSWLHNNNYCFEKLYERKQFIKFKNAIIPTLSYEDSMHYLIENCKLENYMCLRNLLDISQISKYINQKQDIIIKKEKNLNQICKLTFEITKNKKLLQYIKDSPSFQNKKILKHAQKYQMLSYRSFGNSNFFLQSRLYNFYKKVFFVNNMKSILTLILFTLLPPKFLINSKGEEINVLISIKNRFLFLRKKIFI